jgi:hypothetical protein
MINNKPIEIEAFKNILKEGIIFQLNEAEYKGKEVELNKPFRTPDGPKKFGVYVKNDKGNVIIIRFGDPNMEIKRDDPERRKAYRARHKGDKIHDKTKAGYWSWKFWGSKNVSDLLKENNNFLNEQLNGGLSDGLSLKDIAIKHNVDFNTLYKQYLLGLNVEREHTSDIDKIIEIVKDHLFEKPDYYSKLNKLDL